MKIQEKPDYLIFADSAKNGESANFPDVSRGWGVTIDQTASKPPMEWMNGAFNRIDKNMIYLLQQGVPEWSETVIYPVNAIIKYNGVLYTAIVENDNAIPTTSNKWKKTIAEAPNASTTQKGIVKLSSDTNSTSETEAATPNAVKKACDLASGAVKKSGDTMTGQLILSEFGIKHRYTDSENLMVLRTLGDNYSCMFYDAEKKQWLSKLVYNSTTNSWNFPSIDDVKINNKSVLKTGDYGIGSLTGAKLDNPDETLKGGYYATRTTEFTELTEYQNRNDSASLVVYPAWTEKWYVEKLAVVQSKTPRIYYRCATPEGKQSWYEALTTANVNNYIPVGVPLPWPTNKPPSGWLECNGSWFDKNQFPKLAAAYPSGSLPDLRGVFIRGKDNGRGLDPNRAILSYQDDAIRNIYGEISPISESFGASPIATGAFRYFEKHADHSPAHIDVGSVGGVTFDASRVVATANENRPRNIAFMYIVKAE